MPKKTSRSRPFQQRSEPVMITPFPGMLESVGRRWMFFVDGENFTMRAQDFARSRGLTLHEGKYYLPNVYVWLPNSSARSSMIPNAPLPIQPMAIRAYYYTSAVGDEQRLALIRQSLWELGFHAEVFKKDKQQQKSKGVDLTLARDVLVNAFSNNYDAAVLLAGDADYLPIVNEVKRMGKLVYVIFFHGEGSGLNPRLHLASDQFFSINDSFVEGWRTLISR